MAKLGKRLKYQNDEEKPVTISLRLPKELHARLERYATQHRQSISELVRDGLEWRLSDGDPRGLGDGAGTNSPQEYYCNTQREQGTQEAEALQEVRRLLRQQWEQIQTLAQAFERQKVLDGDGVYSSNTGIQLRQQGHSAEHEPVNDTAPMESTLPGAPEGVAVQPAHTVVVPMTYPVTDPVTDTITDTTASPPAKRKASSRRRAITATVADTVTVTNPPLEPFDTTKYRLGTLCPRSHDYHGTGQSLRKKNKAGGCLACDAEKARARRQAKRQEVSA